MRKLVSMLLAMLLVLALVPTAFADDVYTLDYYWIGNSDNAVREEVQNAINEYIEPLIGCHVVFHIIGWNDWSTKAVAALQSGEKIDIIFTADWRDYSMEVSTGLLNPLNDLLAKYGQGILESINPAFITGTQVAGVNYAVPTNKELCVPEGFIVNKKAAEAIGWNVVPDDPSITCTADLEPWLQKYKQMFPDKYPYLMDGSNGRWADEPWCPDWMTSNICNYVAMKMSADDETIYSIYDTEEQAEHIRLMYKWAQTGYISPDASLTSFDYTAISNAGDFLVYTAPLKGNNIKSQELINASGNPDLEWVEITMQPKYVVTTHSGGSMLGIPVTSEAPEKALQYINLMHTDTKLVNMMLYGVEGKQWEYAEDGRVNLIDSSWNGAHGGAWTVGNTVIQAVTTSEDPQKNALLASYADDAIPTQSLGFRFVQDNVANEMAAMINVVEEYIKPLNCGAVDPDDPERGIEALRQAMMDNGIEKIMAEAQAQYDAWKAAK